LFYYQRLNKIYNDAENKQKEEQRKLEKEKKDKEAENKPEEKMDVDK
jgi:hypothetical protein